MYNPTRDQVRQFFADTWVKYRQGAPLAGLETTALDLILQHPEYHALLESGEERLGQDYTPESGQANPFLRADLPEVAAAVGMSGKPAAEVFTEIRARKNKF